jgi:hypothetical protein
LLPNRERLAAIWTHYVRERHQTADVLVCTDGRCQII